MSTITIRPFLAAKLLTFGALCLGGCHLTGIRGNGDIVTENRQVREFTSVEAEGAFDIEWTPGPPSCTIRTDENLLRHVETSMNGKKLTLEWHGQLHPTHGMKVKISSASMTGARLTGAVRLAATRLSGTGFYLEGTGATRVTADGAVDELLATMSGASKLDAQSLQVRTAELSISGAGKVTYNGNPSIERHISGAGSVRKRD